MTDAGIRLKSLAHPGGFIRREIIEPHGLNVTQAARLQPLAIKKMRLAASPPRDTRFGRPLELAKVHWLRPERVAEVTYLSWPDDGLLRHTVFVGLREDKPAREVRRETLRTT